MRRDNISIRYRQVSILRRWSITTLSRHQLLRDEHSFIFCYRLKVAKRRKVPTSTYCERPTVCRKRERLVRVRERFQITWRTNRVSDQVCLFSVWSYFLATLAWRSSRYDAHFYTRSALSCSLLWQGIRMCVHAMHRSICMCIRTMLPLLSKDFTVWRNFDFLSSCRTSWNASLKWI